MSHVRPSACLSRQRRTAAWSPPSSTAGTAIPSEKFAGSKLFDELVDGDVLPAAVMFAQSVAAAPGPYPKVRDLKVRHENSEGFLAFAKNTVAAVAKNFPAPSKIGRAHV